MPSVDFAEWVEPNLLVTLGGRDYSVPPPSVADARIIVAFAVLAEHRLGLVRTEPDPALLELANAQTDPLPVITLGRAVYDQMVTDGVSDTTISRVGYYGMHYWARGKVQADYLAAAMWAPDKDVTDTAPKAPKRSKNGRSTASANQTKTASIPTTKSRQSSSRSKSTRRAASSGGATSPATGAP